MMLLELYVTPTIDSNHIRIFKGKSFILNLITEAVHLFKLEVTAKSYDDWDIYRMGQI